MSRSLDDLRPAVKARVERFLAVAAGEGIDLLVTQTRRTNAEQDALYAQGRSIKGAVVTNARGGESWHNWDAAVDVVPMRAGKPVWDTAGDNAKLWLKVGALGEACGLEWAGRWNGKLREMAHFQYRGGLSLSDVRAGKEIK